MRTEVRQDIKNLEDEILQLENNIVEFLDLKYDKRIKKSLLQLESDLKYLSILANGAPLDKSENREIMDFLRIHYDYLKKLSVPA